jgi:hypothetical protein
MQRILDDLATNYDRDCDGRPPVEHHGYDPLLAALIREHPEKMPSREIAVNSRDDR